MHLFTYGTLMFPEVWQAVVGRQFETTPAQLPGYQIFRVRDAVYPGIIALYPGIIESSPQPSAISSQPTSSSSSDSRPSTLDSGLSPVPGLVYLDVDPESLVRLDAFEGHDYIRRSVTVVCKDDTSALGRELTADTYIVPTESAHILTPEPWTAANFLAAGLLTEFVTKYSGFNRLAEG
jgi:gamma-glutamylcyclotransferase (GGCT)/AIG2-like uncharacterized protein YtfP